MLFSDDNTTVKNITLSPNETYSLLDQFTQEPYNTTDTVTWTSSDPTVATIKNGGTMRILLQQEVTQENVP